MNMQQMLGESGRTMSNEDRQIMDMMMRKGQEQQQPQQPQRMPLPDNEPRMGDRSPDNQMFSIESEISNLMKSYNMLVEAQDFQRAQQVADQINMLDVQKRQAQAQQANAQAQAQRDPQEDEISRILDSISI